MARNEIVRRIATAATRRGAIVDVAGFTRFRGSPAEPIAGYPRFGRARLRLSRALEPRPRLSLPRPVPGHAHSRSRVVHDPSRHRRQSTRASARVHDPDAPITSFPGPVAAAAFAGGSDQAGCAPPRDIPRRKRTGLRSPAAKNGHEWPFVNRYWHRAQHESAKDDLPQTERPLPPNPAYEVPLLWPVP